MSIDERHDRLDDVIGASLRWQAERATEITPPFDDAMRALAARIGPAEGVATDGLTRRTWVLMAAAALLVTLLVGTLAIGTGLIRLPWQEDTNRPFEVDPPIFGFPAECRSSTPGEGTLLEMRVADALITLYDDGSLVTVQPAAAEALAFQSYSAVITQRRLGVSGIELMLDAITDAGLGPGCRDLYSTTSMSLRAWLDSGPVFVTLATFPGVYSSGPSLVRVMTADEEASVTDLFERLQKPETWLPADAWVDQRERTIAPEQWEVSTSWYDSGQGPGDRIQGPNGKLIDGSNPAFAAIVLPNGDPLDEPACLVASTEEAEVLAALLDEATHLQDFAWYVFSEDLRREYAISVSAVLPGSTPCSTPAFGAPPAEGAEPTPSPTPAHSDEACSLVPADAIDDLPEGALEAGEPTQLLDIESATCHLLAASDGGFSHRVGMLALLGRPVSLEQAASLATGLLGTGTTEEPVGGHVIWMSACWSRTCPPAIAGWSGDRFFLLAFSRNAIGGESFVAEETARELARVVADSLAR